MKKLLGATLAIVMGATLVGGLAACNTNDDEKNADIAKKAISTVRAMYLDKAKETPATYTVIGQSKVDGTNYDVNWTATPAADCTIENFSNYVSVGEMASDKLVTVSITKSTEMVINYKLNASVTVGNATESVSFDRTVPKSNLDVQTQSAEINLSATSTRTSTSATQQIWEENGVKLTNDKGSSVTDVADVVPIRIYKSSSVKIEYPGMLQLVFHSNKALGTSDYASYLLQSLQADLGNIATITSDSTNADDPTVTVTLNNAVDVLEFTANAGQIRLTKIDIDAVVGGATDADKVAVAKASLDLATKNYTATGDYDLPATKNGANISWAVKGTSENVSIEGGKLKVNSMPSAETEVTLTATISSGSVNDTKDVDIKLVPLGITNDGTLEHPYTPSEAKLVAKQTLAEGATAATEVYVKGYVIAPGTYSSQYGNFDNMYIADVYAADKETTADDALYVYRPKPDGTYLTTEGFTKGDLVTFKGKLQNYKADTQELTSGTCVARTIAVDERTDAEKVAAAKAALSLNEKYAAGEETLPATNNGATLTWAVTSGTNVTISGNTMTITSPADEVEVTLTVTITCGDVTDTKEITFTVVALNYGTIDSPLSVTEALALTEVECVNSNDVTSKVVYMIGKLTNEPTDKTTYYQNLYLADPADASKSILVYSINLRANTVAAPVQNDVLVICGYIKNYNGTIEFATNSGTNVYIESNTRGSSAITLGAHSGATVTGLPESATNGTQVAFTVAAEAGNEIVAVKVGGVAVEGTSGSYTFTVAGDTAVTVETKAEGAQDASVLNTLSFGSGISADSEKVGSYTSSYEATRGDLTWTISGFNNNQNAWSFIKTGRKGNAVVGTITTKTAIAARVTKVTVTLSSVTVANVNSFKLLVSSDADFADEHIVDTIQINAATGENTFAINNPGENYYYRIVVDCASGTANGFVVLDKVELWGYEA